MIFELTSDLRQRLGRNLTTARKYFDLRCSQDSWSVHVDIRFNFDGREDIGSTLPTSVRRPASMKCRRTISGSQLLPVDFEDYGSVWPARPMLEILRTENAGMTSNDITIEQLSASHIRFSLSLLLMPAMKLDGRAMLAATIASGPKPRVFEDKLEERAWRKFRLAQALRIFGNRGYDEGIAGHITVRDPIETECFWVNPWGLHFKLIQPEDLLLVDSQGKILQAGKSPLLNTAAFLIHSKIHAARPDVICAAHSHSVYGKAFAALGKPLDMISQDSCAFYNDHAVYTDYRGIALDVEEGEAIAKALGSYKAAILQNHGLLVACDTIEAAVYFYISLEKSCQVQLLADAAGETVKIPTHQAAETGSKVGNKIAGWFSGKMEFDLLENEENNVFRYFKQ